MSKSLRLASVFSLVLTAVATVSATDASFALEANDEIPETRISIDPALISGDDSNENIIFGKQREITAEIPQDMIDADRLANKETADPVESDAGDTDFTNNGASSLRHLVSQQAIDNQLSAELNCLAGAIYFESKGETYDGQLAVARVVMARAASPRFPNSICGVVYQPSQFSFVRGGKMPTINKGSAHWRDAVAIAKIAMNDGWESPVEGALFFHARHVSPNWRLKRMARIDNHIFYR